MNINPEKNIKVRAILYVVGCGGIFHLLILLATAIIKNDASYFNPFYTVDADQIWPAVTTSVFLYFLGWVCFFGLIYIIFRLLQKQNDQ